MAAIFNANYGTLLLRLVLGVVFVFHGGQKLFGLFGGDGPDALAGMIHDWGWPQARVLARVVGAVEFFGGAALLLGLLTRWFAAALTLVMVVAAWKVHLPNGFALADGGVEYVFVLGVLCLGLVVQGGGAWSLDELFFARKKKPKPKE